MQFRGAYTAIVTPFKNGGVDEEGYRRLIERQIEQGIHGIVPCGTTGESATLSHDEHKRCIAICVDQVKGRVPVLAGAGSNNTDEAIDLTRAAKDAGADGALLITPYYNKPPQRGLIEHFKAIAKEVSLPFIVYNVPGRTGTNLLPATLAEMAKQVPEVVGVKEATADLIQISRIYELCGPDFMILSGDDFTVLPTLAVGGCGAISVVSNVVPNMMASLCEAFFEKRNDDALKLHYDLNPLSRAMFMDTNPIPAKTALAMLGLIDEEIRLPLCPMEPEMRAELQKILKDQGVL